MSRPVEPAWIAVGKITRAHGVRGEVSVMILTEVGSRFEPGSRLFLGQDESRPVTVSAARPHQKRFLVRLEEVADRASAESLQGSYLFVPAGQSPPLAPGRFWPYQLIGCDVVTESGRNLGVVREVVHSPSNDLWVAASGEGEEVLVPALRDVVASVDLDGRTIVVLDVPGLTAP